MTLLQKIWLFFITLLLSGCASSDKQYDFRITQQEYQLQDSSSLAGDLYLPNNSSLRPAVLVIHGGGWVNRTGDMQTICKKIAHSGMVAFNITYRLAPDHRHPTQLNDVNAALKWLNKNAKKFRIDSQKIAIWGYSAGAHLGLLLGLNPTNNIKAIVAGGTPADLTQWPKSPLVKKLIGTSMEEAPEAWANASPVNHVQTNSPPTFLYHGDWDLIVSDDQMDYMEDALKEKGITVETYKASLLGHITVYLWSSKADRLSLSFLKKYLF